MKIKVIMEMQIELDKSYKYYKGLDYVEILNTAIGGTRYDIEKKCSGDFKKIKVTKMTYEATQKGEVKL